MTNIVSDYSFSLDDSQFSEQASVLVEDDYYFGDVVQVFSSPKRQSTSPQKVNRADANPDLDPHALRIIEEVIIGAEIAVTTNFEKSKRFHGRVIQGKTRVMLKDVLRIYNRYREELCIDTILDSDLYTFLVDLDMTAENNWWGKLDAVLGDPGNETRNLILKKDAGNEEDEALAENYYAITTLQKCFWKWKEMVKIAEDGRVPKPLLTFSAHRWIRSSTLPVLVLFDSKRDIFKMHGVPARVSDRFPLSDEGLKIATRAIGSMEAWLMQKLYGVWHRHTVKILHVRKKSITRKRNLCFFEWQQYTLTNQFHRRILEPWGDNWVPFFKRFMLKKFYFRVQERKELWKLHAERANQKRIMGTAFNIWYDLWDTKKRMMKFILRWQNLGVLKTFEQWVMHVEEAKEHRRKVSRSLRRLQNKNLADTFDGWYKVVYDTKEENRKLTRFIRRMKNNELMAAFSGWASNVHQIVSQRYLVNKFLRTWQQREILAIFNTWYDHAQVLKEQRLKVIRHRKYVARKTRQTYFIAWWYEKNHGRILRDFLREKNEALATEIFYQWARQTKEMLMWFKQLSKERRKRKKFHLYRAWRLRTIEWQRKKRLIGLGEKHKESYDKFAAVRAWRVFSKRQKIRDEHKVKSHNFMLRMYRKQSFRGFLNNLYVARRLKTFAIRGKLVETLQVTRYAFRAWYYSHRETKMERNLVMGRVRRRQAVKKWQAYIAEKQRLKLAHDRVHKYRWKSIMTVIVSSWRSLALKHLELREDVGKLDVKMRARKMQRAVRWWNTLTKGQAYARNATRKAQVLHNRHVKQRSFLALRDVTELWAKTKGLRTKVRKSYLQFRFSQWATWTAAQRGHKKNMGTAVRKHKLSLKGWVFTVWHRNAKFYVHGRKLYSEATDHWRLSLLRKSFDAGFRAKYATRLLSKQADMQHTLRVRHQTFDCWVKYTGYRRKVNNARKYSIFQVLRKRFRNWKEFGDIVFQDKIQRQHNLGVMKRFKQFAAIKKWRQMVVRRREIMLTKLHCDACLKYMTLTRRSRFLKICFREWKMTASQGSHLEACEQILSQRHRRFTLRSTIRAWAIWLEEETRYGK